jgi:hypothetical protein
MNERIVLRVAEATRFHINRSLGHKNTSLKGVVMKNFRTGVYKPAIALVLITLLSLILFGCGGGGGDNGGNSQTESNQWDAMVWDQDDWG